MTRIRVLYVDPDGRDGDIATALADEFDLRVAESGLDALTLLTEESIDCVVSPLDLPRITVTEFVKRVRMSTSEPALIVVGRGGPERALAALDAGATDHIESGLGASREVTDRVRGAVASKRIDDAFDRHDTLHELLRRTATEVAEATTRSTVERILHTQFSESTLYRMGWVGCRTDGGSLRLHFPIEATVTLDERVSEASSALSRAYRERRSVVASHDGETTPEHEDGWRFPAAEKNATPRTAMIPFHHAGTVHGVLVLSSRRSDAFDRSERAVLDDLGRIVGGALDRCADGTDGAEERRRFASALAHELRSPLGIASQYLELAQDSNEENAIDRARRALDRADRTIEGILAITEPAEPAERTKKSLERVATRAWEHVDSDGAELVLEESAEITANREALIRLFENLFRNAIEHGRRDGDSADRSADIDGHTTGNTPLTVRVGTLDDAPGFYVEDDGVGLPAKPATLFEWGYSTSDDGMGLGLSIVKEIAEAHGWTVHAEEREGARFEVREGSADRIAVDLP